MVHLPSSFSMGLCIILFLAGFISKELVDASWPSLVLNDLSPPPGNSLTLKAKTRNGRQSYGCVNAEWKLLNASAELIDSTNSTRVGSYHFYHRAHSGGTWTLKNRPEEFVESGYATSEVSGAELAREETGDGCFNILAEAAEHKHIGTASLVSYIQTFVRKVEPVPVPVVEGNCTRGSGVRQVSYEAEYWLWIQDRLPPVDTPRELLVSEDRLVEGFFGKGVVSYVYNGTGWVQKEWNAMLYDVPGGSLVGQHNMRPDQNTSRLVWEIFSPYGFGISGISSRDAVQVAENCMPWSLYAVTDSWGDVSLLGPFQHVQMVSTRGGTPPEGASPLKPLQFEAGQIYNTTFSAVFWFYSKL